MVVRVLAFCALVVTCAFASESCTYTLTESIPLHTPGLVSEHRNTTTSWLQLISDTQQSLDIASFYWSLSLGSEEFGGDDGKEILAALRAAHKRGVAIRVVETLPSEALPDTDSAQLAKEGVISLRILNMTKFFGSGILHTKFMVSDQQRAWVGSANMDWRSLAQVKELGVQLDKCQAIAADMDKVFEEYWIASEDDTLPVWPKALATAYNEKTPLDVAFNGAPAKVFLTSSPAAFATQGRTTDLDGIRNTILGAKKSVSIEVMDYMPATLYQPHNVYWPDIDDALRTAAFSNGVNVRLLIGNWSNSDPAMFPLLRSLQSVNEACSTGSIEVKLFTVPPDPHGDVPFARVNHAKFLVTDSHASIGTSNWSGDYFLTTGGVSLNVQEATFVGQVQAVFDRDWDSKFASPLKM